jgi:hypothetical protein
MILEEQYVKFLIEHDLTQNQYLLLHLIYKKRIDLVMLYKNRFPTEDGTMIGEYFTKDLYTRGFLEDVIEKGKKVVRVTEKFLYIIINKYEAANQIYEIYPTFLDSNGTHIPLKSMDINVFANIYDSAIMSNVKEHLEVIEDIKYGIENNLLNIGIEKFVKSKHWLSIRKERLSTENKTIHKTVIDNEF